jgi:hypothetical protein
VYATSSSWEIAMPCETNVLRHLHAAYLAAKNALALSMAADHDGYQDFVTEV